MRAVAVVPGQKGSLHLRDDAAEPRPADGEATVRVVEAGVCGTDVEIDMGLYGRAPEGSDYLILGHENLGVVERSPAGSGLAPGDLVVSTVRRPCPERCRACVHEQQDMCLTGHFLERGIGGLHGFMSERYTESPHNLVRLPPELRGVAVLLEPMTIVQKGVDQAFRIQQRLAWDPRKCVVLGAGPVGLLAAIVLRLRGLEVIVAALEPEDSPKAKLAAEAGIRYVSTAKTPIEQLPSVVGRIDVVFEATGATAVVFPAMSILGPNGVCILSSVTGGQKKIEVDLATWNRDFVLGNRLVFGTVNAGRRHFESGVRDLSGAQERFGGWLDRLITRRVPLAEAARAFQRAPSDIKTVLQFD
jgi:threonine dehydrogenase-like Zn-dependent dehydrogenase